MKDKLSLEEINTNTKEGRYLMAALAKLTTESQTDKTPYEVLNQCHILQEQMFSGKPFDNSLTNWTPITGEESLPKDDEALCVLARYTSKGDLRTTPVEKVGFFKGMFPLNEFQFYTILQPPVK